jgi:hypothetical protein
VKNIERDAADLVAIVSGDEDRIVPMSQVGPFAQEAPRKLISRIHRLDIARQFSTASIGDGSGINEIEVVEWHWRSKAMALRTE